MYYVYIIKSKKNSKIYIGYTNDLRRRLEEHNTGQSKATKNNYPYGLIYYEAYRENSDAKYRENNLKRFSQAYTQLKKRIKNSLNND